MAVQFTSAPGVSVPSKGVYDMNKIGSKRLLQVGLAVAALATGLQATVAGAATFNVFTGYADNIRPSGFFPNPWLGGANVVSQTPTGQSIDAGAIRIQNTGAIAITITSLSVILNGGGGPTFNIWSPLTIGAGKDGIFTQTFSYNFDSSDYSTGGAPGGLVGSSVGSNGIGGCSSTAVAQALAGITAYCAARQPIVSFLANGTLFTANDSGHILDTGNYDFINGSTDGNESINWNIIGSGAVRGGNGVPEPTTWALMILGLGSVGAVMRRTRKHAAA